MTRRFFARFRRAVALSAAASASTSAAAATLLVPFAAIAATATATATATISSLSLPSSTGRKCVGGGGGEGSRSLAFARFPAFAPCSFSTRGGPYCRSDSSSTGMRTTKTTATMRTRHATRFLRMSSEATVPAPFLATDDNDDNNDAAEATTAPDYNSVQVAKTGGRGSPTAGQVAAERGLTLGAPRAPRPGGGHFLTRGGVQVTAHVERVPFGGGGRGGKAGVTVGAVGANKAGRSETMATATTTEGIAAPLETGFAGKKSMAVDASAMIEHLVDRLDTRRGVLLSSSYEFPGRYARWSLGFVDPPLEISGRGQKCSIRALNERGTVLLPAVIAAMENLRDEGTLEDVTVDDGGKTLRVTVVPPPEVGAFSEEERSRQPSLFSVVRALVDLFGFSPARAESVDGGQLGLYGSFGYDLTFQFEPIDLARDRPDDQRDLLLYLPDEVLVVDQDRRDAWKIAYDFCYGGKSTEGMDRGGGADAPFRSFNDVDADAVLHFQDRDTPPGEFAESVERAKREFAVGNLFEAVLSQTFRRKLDGDSPPSAIFRRLRSRNPAPYGFLMNLGEDEFLVGASPEMFVRCEATNENDYFPGAVRVETCPISGTVARGADALEDALRVKSLMMNAKEESELTMCTDVDRNDKSRICIPGSVQVIGRRQIEMYSRLIHTVDHVEGYLRPEFDALDAFLCHTWAVTVTGAPKTWAIQFVEDNERTPRAWYGGAVGMVGFDGGLNTGLTLRTVRVKGGVAEVRAGATLLYDSNPPAEELETELKASAMIDAVVRAGPEDEGGAAGGNEAAAYGRKRDDMVGEGKRIILIDHEDSFVHTLGNYLRQTGADVSTLRSGPSALESIRRMIEQGSKPDMVVLSPGPGNPTDFALSKTLDFLVKNRIPGFGVCLGLQGMVEHFGGKLGVLGYPMHGKPSPVSLTPLGKAKDSIFSGLPDTFEVARYHSLHGIRDKMPVCLEVTALSEDGIVMGIKHSDLPYAAVQFHPESILTSPAHGMTILKNALAVLRYNDDGDGENAAIPDGKPSAVEIVAELEELGVSELKERLLRAGLGSSGTKSQLIVRLALWMHKAAEFKSGRLELGTMTVPELRELKQGLGLKGTAPTKSELIYALDTCLKA